jgi:hypothetical protein
MSSQKIAVYGSTPVHGSVDFQPFPVATNFTDTVIGSFVMDYYDSDGSIVSLAAWEEEKEWREKEGGREEGREKERREKEGRDIV